MFFKATCFSLFSAAKLQKNSRIYDKRKRFFFVFSKKHAILLGKHAVLSGNTSPNDVIFCCQNFSGLLQLCSSPAPASRVGGELERSWRGVGEGLESDWRGTGGKLGRKASPLFDVSVAKARQNRTFKKRGGISFTENTPRNYA